MKTEVVIDALVNIRNFEEKRRSCSAHVAGDGTVPLAHRTGPPGTITSGALHRLLGSGEDICIMGAFPSFRVACFGDGVWRPCLGILLGEGWKVCEANHICPRILSNSG